MLFLNRPLTVIAEIGINHEGSLQAAKEMAESAVRAGADVVKFQTHIPEAEMHEGARSVLMSNGESMWDHFSRCALSEKDEFALFDYVEKELGAVFMSTPFSLQALDRLERIGVRAHKIGSGEADCDWLLDAVLKTGKQFLVSCGLSYPLGRFLLAEQCIPMACSARYPAEPEETAPVFGSKVWGYSDHSADGCASIAMAAKGASVIERHFVDSKNIRRTAPDLAVSSDEHEFRHIMRWCRAVHPTNTGHSIDTSAVRKYTGRRLIDGAWKRPA